MPDASPGYTKSFIKRALREIIDPQPSKKERENIWDFFQSKCAYCSATLVKGQREGHIDHLVSVSEGGFNHIPNRVLSCVNCNEKEKSNMPWKEFLRRKTNNTSEFLSKKNKIIEWQKQNKLEHPIIDDRTVKKIERMADEELNRCAVDWEPHIHTIADFGTGNNGVLMIRCLASGRHQGRDEIAYG